MKILRNLLFIIGCLTATPALSQTETFSTYVTGLAAVGSVIGTERMFALQSGIPKTITPYQILNSVTAGDCTITAPSIICTKSNGVAFAASATTNALNASNINSGSLPLARLALTNGTVYIGNASNIPVAIAMSGDCTITNVGVITCPKANGVTFATSATTDTTNATNIIAGTLANARSAATNLAGSGNGGVTGILPYTNMPTNSLDSVLGFWASSTIGPTGVPNCSTGALQYSTTTHAFTCNVGGGSGSVTSLTAGSGLTASPSTITTTGSISLSAARRTLPTLQGFGSGSGTYTTPANVLWIKVKIIGGGGGGGGGSSDSTATSGSNGSTTSFGTSFLTAGGGTGGGIGNNGGGGGGTAAGGNLFNGFGNGGSSGSPPALAANGGGGAGGGSCIGGGGANSSGGASTNSGGGGGGGIVNNVSLQGSGGTGGGAGGCIETLITSPLATYSFTVGTNGGGGAAGTNGQAGGAGAVGYIVVEEHYGS